MGGNESKKKSKGHFEIKYDDPLIWRKVVWIPDPPAGQETIQQAGLVNSDFNV